MHMYIHISLSLSIYIYMCIYIYIYIYLFIYIYNNHTIYIHIFNIQEAPQEVRPEGSELARCSLEQMAVRPVHLLRVFLLRVLESNFPGDSLYNYTDMRIPTL